MSDSQPQIQNSGDTSKSDISPASLSTPLSAPPSANSSPGAPLGLNDEKQFRQQQQHNKKILWGIFGLLSILVIGVIFILPRYIAPPETSPVVVVENTPITQASDSGNQISPFDEAQKLKQREGAQNVLAELLVLQESLQQKGGETWAQDEFSTAIEFARAGDTSYSQQDFVNAEQNYRTGLDILQTIEGRTAEVFSQYLEIGNASILTGNVEAANEAFTLAVLIDPQDDTAVSGLARSQLLSSVLDLLTTGSELHQNLQLEAALENYQQALAIDTVHVGATASLAQVRTDIIDRDFSNLMSAGYASIQGDSPERAQNSFKQALVLKPNSNEALSALEQAQDQMTFNSINSHLNAAQNHESGERWQQALNSYNNALEVDSNLVAALEGKNRTNSRYNLDIFLENTIAEPLRLAEVSIFEQTVRIHGEANNISLKGQKLTTQLSQVQTLLAKVNQPVNISFLSDGLTDVTLYRVNNLGKFTSQTLALTPGTYVAVGVREGYRDVRQEFIISIDGSAPSVTIICDEKIQ